MCPQDPRFPLSTLLKLLVHLPFFLVFPLKESLKYSQFVFGILHKRKKTDGFRRLFLRDDIFAQSLRFLRKSVTPVPNAALSDSMAYSAMPASPVLGEVTSAPVEVPPAALPLPPAVPVEMGWRRI